MYEPPIQLIMNDALKQIQTAQENTIYKTIQSIGVNVDKDELIKALRYDRLQYQKGFDDGYHSFADDFYNKFKKCSKGCNPDALIRMSDIIKILISVKAGE